MTDKKAKMAKETLSTSQLGQVKNLEKITQYMNQERVSMIISYFQILLAKVLILFKLSRPKDIYTAMYIDYANAMKGDYSGMINGIYNKIIAESTYKKIIIQKLDMFGLDKNFISSRLKDCQLSLLEAQSLTNKKASIKTRLLEEKKKHQKDINKHKEKSEGDENTTLEIISSKLNNPISPTEISTYKVFQTIERIKKDHDSNKK